MTIKCVCMVEVVKNCVFVVLKAVGVEPISLQCFY